eukprot:4559764-Prymnesium_polylepis.1
MRGEDTRQGGHHHRISGGCEMERKPAQRWSARVGGVGIAGLCTSSPRRAAEGSLGRMTRRTCAGGDLKLSSPDALTLTLTFNTAQDTQPTTHKLGTIGPSLAKIFDWALRPLRPLPLDTGLGYPP